MQKGDFFRVYFSERGSYEVKANGEVNVLCPFPHDNGYDSNSSAHVNSTKGLFHCKTCFAQGRLDSGGMSEVGFIANLYSVDYEEALNIQHTLTDDDPAFSNKAWPKSMELLRNNKDYMAYLQEERGLTPETVHTYMLGYAGDGIAYPVIIHGDICDIRTYHPHEDPKMTSKKGASPLLFPFDVWRKDDRPTILCAGENDCLITRQNGFNALTVTAGEGSFPKMFLKMFDGKTVYIIYDCDLAGRNSSRRIAFQLKDAGANVLIVDLGLEGTKADKDLTDYFLKHNKTTADLQALLDVAEPYDGKQFQEDKNTLFPLVDLWDIPEGYNSGRRLSSRVVVSGKYDTAMQTPSAVEWNCFGYSSENSICETCPLKKNRNGMWILGEHNLKDMMQLVDVPDKQQKPFIRQMLEIPKECPGCNTYVKARKSVYKVILTPDVETEDILSGFRSAEQYAYTIGLNLEDGSRYRAYFKAFAHPLDGQRVFMIVDRVEDSDNALNSFKMTEQIVEQLKVFQGDPMEKMAEKALRMHGIPDMTFKPSVLIAHAVNLLYHSPLRIQFKAGKSKVNTLKGFPEILVVGESGSGKTETALFWQRYVQIGNFMALKGASISSLQGGAESMSRGGFKVAWGVIPQNNKGLVILDEMSGMNQDVLNNLTAMRSSGIATIPKIKRATAPAHTRLLWTSNPKKKPTGQMNTIYDYPNGAALIIDLIGTDEDIRRFDVCVLVAKGTDNSSPLDEPELECHPADTYRNLIYWAWTRTAEQIIFEEGVEKYIVQMADELNDKYDTDVKLLGGEAWKKLARLAVSCAVNCFSHTDGGDSVLVCKSHVDWAAYYIALCYDNNLFRIRDYAKECRSYNTTNQSVNLIVAAICRTNPMVIKALLNSTTIVPMGNLRTVSNLEPQAFNELINKLSTYNLIRVTAHGLTSTRRLKMAVDAYRESSRELRMTPIALEGTDEV